VGPRADWPWGPPSLLYPYSPSGLSWPIIARIRNIAMSNIKNLLIFFCHIVHYVVHVTVTANSDLYGISFGYQTSLGPGSSVGIAADYGLDGPRSNSGGNEIFRPSRPNLGPSQPPVQWVPGLYRG